ncbi:di-N-acetylchitobiase [Octopus sinensis]|uniref:Di-N-acetylchitobiase n=1 Tax=Octopus sinensis TaxID=2607531 RepID=A0A6P7SIA3_9MOLL|nr:di-N-acetylchitobiase [Octopus sinensis]
MVRLTSSDLTAENVTVITDVISELKSNLVSVSSDISFLCLISWFPPCREYQCKFIKKMLSVCDKFMLNAESFINHEETHCLAQAAVPITKLHFGFDEYMVSGVSPQKFILSVPWHGYVYLCDIFKPKGNGSLYDQCFIRKKNGSQTCDYNHCRQKLDMNTMAEKYMKYESENIWNAVYLAPYFNIEETPGEFKQIWFEDYRSLNHKYEYIRTMNVSGIALWSGNDLQHSSSSWYETYNKVMWGWLAHQALMHPQKPNSYENLKKLPQLMAGIGIGCVLIGGLLGFIFGWGVFRRTHKRNRRQPFDKDMVYMEEDQNL